jgi:hypothetical protein
VQEEAMKILGLANQIIKSILNIIYDLKEFQVRLELYDKLKSSKKEEKEAAFLSLKQVWLDTVDVKRQNTSIKGLATSQAAQFVTLIDAFMLAENEKLEYQGKELDLNETVKRILKQRIIEFLIWLKESERELRKRFEVEKIYLRSQVNTVKLYARWAKPYLKAAKALEQRATGTSALVTAFNTSLFELSLIGEGKYDPAEDVVKGILPKVFKSATKKAYTPIIVIEIQFRSVPERAQAGGYGFRGRLESTFTSYVLTSDELKLLKEEIEKDDVGDMLKQIEGATDESLAQINADIEYYLEDKKSEKEKKEKKKASEEDNPFAALFSLFKKEKTEGAEKKEGKVTLSPDTELEKVIRSQAAIVARIGCFKMYEIYKKSHSMPFFPQ